MRRLPASWIGTRTKLGVKRVVKNGGRRPAIRIEHRKLPLEQLESRYVLAAIFEITAGATSSLFEVDTTYDNDSDEPHAVLRLADGADLSGDPRHRIELSLVESGNVISTQDVRITFPDAEILETFREHRIDRGRDLLTPLPTSEVDDVFAQLGGPTGFLDLDACSADSDVLLSWSQINTALDRFGLLTKAVGSQSAEARERLYAGLDSFLSTIDSIADSRGASPLSEADEHRIGAMALALADSVGPAVPAEITAAATEAISDLLRHSDLYHTVWTGLGVNSEITVVPRDELGEVHYSMFYEAGTGVVNPDLSVTFGRSAVVTAEVGLGYATVHWPARWAALLVGEFGPVLPDADAYAYSGELDTFNSGNETTLAVANWTSGGTPAEMEAYVRFDLDDLLLPAGSAQDVTGAAVTLHQTSVDAGVTQLRADVVLDNDWDESNTGWNLRPQWRGNWLDTWNPQTVQQTVEKTVTLDVTEEVRRELRFGDMDFSESLDYNATTGGSDFAAYELYRRSPQTYVDLYPVSNMSSKDILYRADRIPDGLFHFADAAAFFKRIGQVYGDFTFNGLVEQGDLDKVLGGWGDPADEYTDGDANFSGLIEQGDHDVVLLHWGHSRSGVVEQPKLTIRIYAPNQTSGFQGAFYASRENTNADLHPELLATQSPDSDGDGLTDAEETQVTMTFPNEFDSDGDLLGDAFEYYADTLDPLSPDNNQSDPDMDGLNNLGEQTHGTDPDEPDTDGDGTNDADESGQGSDPNDPSDMGQAPPADQVVRLELAVGEEHGNERWALEMDDIAHPSPDLGDIFVDRGGVHV